jgi:hypothetical protein
MEIRTSIIPMIQIQKTAHIKFSARDAFLWWPSSGILIVK